MTNNKLLKKIQSKNIKNIYIKNILNHQKFGPNFENRKIIIKYKKKSDKN